jgi:hypothetical protein
MSKIMGITKIRKLFKTTKEKPKNLPSPDTPIEITVGHGMKVRLNQTDGTWDVLKEMNDGSYQAVNHNELLTMRERIDNLEDENRMLQFKLEILLDLLSRATLDNKLLNAMASKYQKQQKKQQMVAA